MSHSVAQTRWVVAGGGTGGHVTPALALAERIEARGDAILFMGSQRGLEQRLVPEAGYELVALPVQQVMGRGLLGRIAAVPAMLRSCAAAWRLLGKAQTDVVVSVGGYASVPAVIAARMRRVPVALVEPNAVPGRANRAAARFAERLYVQFDAAAEVFARHAPSDRIRVWGIPLRTRLIAAFAAEPARRFPDAPFRLLVFGGSQGARQINEAMIEAATRLDAARITIFHQTGAADRERVAEAYAKAGIEAEVVDFTDDMPDRYAWADLALCRSGALTVAELALAALPALLVPYPFAADDHQTANAFALAEVDAARVLDSRSFSADDLVRVLGELFADPSKLESMGVAAGKLARRDAAQRIVEDCAAMVAQRAGR
jgi:UDP-N-acetylglucosamine--N-acetylmuramyl-(pentapeptide) pyrophosphoryl-undecaprenol N-acetylglucosamine transferase